MNAGGLFLLSLLVEGGAPYAHFPLLLAATPPFLLGVPHLHAAALGLLLLKGACSTAWYATEFLLVERAGAVSTAVAANVNRVCSIACSLALFGNGVTPLRGLRRRGEHHMLGVLHGTASGTRVSLLPDGFGALIWYSSFSGTGRKQC